MSQLSNYSVPVQNRIVEAAYDCLERIVESKRTTKLTVKPMKKLVYQLACHSLIQEILIEFFLPNETMKDKDYMDVEWEDAFKIIDMAAPFTESESKCFINQRLRKEMCDLMMENDEIEEAVKAAEEGIKRLEQAKEMGLRVNIIRIPEAQDDEDFSVVGDSEDEEEVQEEECFSFSDLSEDEEEMEDFVNLAEEVEEVMDDFVVMTEEEFDRDEYEFIEESDC